MGRKRRPVLVLTRSEVIDVRQLVTVAEITTSIRGLAAEVPFNYQAAKLSQPSVVNCDGLHTVDQRSLTSHVATLDELTMADVCEAVAYALSC